MGYPEAESTEEYVEIYFIRQWANHFVAVIEKLLQHDPSQRPSALELSQGDLLPPRVEDEYFKGALQMMGKGFPKWSPVLP